jgi:hypothetical protein
MKPTDSSNTFLSIERNKIVQFDLPSDQPTMSGKPAIDATLLDRKDVTS